MSDPANHEETPLEVLPPSAIMAMEKAQIDMQIATAHQYPRSMELFRKRALSMATLDPETADSCIYVRPVGKEKDAQGNWKEKFAEGPSIRLAEIVAVSYGNLRAASKVVDQTERYVKCAGMAHDLESNTAMGADCIESTVTKDGRPYSERQRALIAKVCAAKALRDAIFKVVPRALCKPILTAAKKVAEGQDKSLEERRKKAQAWIGSLKVAEDRVFAILSVKGWAEVTNDHLLILTGLKTAMADGDETIDSAFPPIHGQQPADRLPDQPKGPLQGQGGQSTGATSTTAPKQDKPTGKPQDSTKPADGVNAPPSAQTTQAPANPPQANPTEQSQAKSDDHAEAEAGLAPQSTGTTQAETSAAPAGPPPELLPVINDRDSAKLKAAKGALIANGVTELQTLAVLRRKKISKEGQKLADLAEAKLDALTRNIGNFVADIKAEPWQ